MAICTLGWNVVIYGESVGEEKNKQFKRNVNAKPFMSTSAAEICRQLAQRDLDRNPDSHVINVRVEVERALGMDHLESGDPTAGAA